MLLVQIQLPAPSQMYKDVMYMNPDQLFQDNQKLVGFCYNKYIRYLNISDAEDIIQQGMLALWKASLQYDDSKGIEFSTYAIHYIRGYMQRYVRDKCNVIRIPSTAFASNNRELINLLSNVESLDKTISGTSDSITLLDKLESNPDDYKRLTMDIIDTFLSTIRNRRDREIMRVYYYATANGDKVTQKQISTKFQVCRSTVTRIIDKYNSEFREFIK